MGEVAEKLKELRDGGSREEVKFYFDQFARQFARLNGYLRAVDWQRNGGIYLSIKLIDRLRPPPILSLLETSF